MGPVDAVVVEAVIEANAACSDRARAEAALEASLAAARAPRRSKDGDARWTLEMRVVVVAPGIRTADARIRDDRGLVVADRSVTDKTAGSCLALARAVGAWAQIVLDELTRVRDEASARVASPTLEGAGGPVPPRAVAHAPAGHELERPPRRDPVDAGAEGEGEAPSARPVEVGTMLFLRNGAERNGGIFGASPFVTYAFIETWVVRPSLAVGTSTSRVPSEGSGGATLTYAGGRVDVCRRMPGNYVARRGIEIDVCAGGDAAYVWSRLDAHVRASVGPSAVVRGELGQRFALETRAMVGANLARGGEVAPFVVAGEVGGSVRFP